MSALPSVNESLEVESPREAFDSSPVHGAYWQPDWRDTYLIAPDEILNHRILTSFGTFDGPDNAAEFNQFQGEVVSDPITFGTRLNIGQLGHPAYLNIMRLPGTDAIDQTDRQNTNGQAQLSGVESIAAMVPYLELPDYGQSYDPSALAGFGGRGGLPFHFDVGKQIDQSSAIGPRQVFRAPPTYGDQTAGVYAAGF